MAAYAPNPHQQPPGSLQPQSHQQYGGGVADINTPHRQSSFGLPSVQRTSTWGSSIMRSIEGVSGDNGSSPANSPPNFQQPAPFPPPAQAAAHPGGGPSSSTQQQSGFNSQSYQMPPGQIQGPGQGQNQFAQFNQFLPNGQPMHNGPLPPHAIPGGYRPSQPTMQGALPQQHQQQQQQQQHSFYNQGSYQQPQGYATAGNPQGSFPPQGQRSNEQFIPQRGPAGSVVQPQALHNGAGHHQGHQWMPQGMRPDETVSPSSGAPVQQLPPPSNQAQRLSPPGNPVHRFPPQGPPGGWKLEESRLDRPPPSRGNRNATGANNGSQQGYGYDKETGDAGPTTSDQGQSGKSGPLQRTDTAQLSGAGSGPGGPLARASTSQFSSSSPPTEQSTNRRVSALFGGIRQRITGGGSESKDVPDAGRLPPGGSVRPPGGPVGLPGGPFGIYGSPSEQNESKTEPPRSSTAPVDEEVSDEESIITHETAEQRNRNSLVPSRGHGHKPSDNDSIVAHSPNVAAPLPSPQFASSEKKPTLLSSMTSRVPNKPSMSDVPRPSMSSNAPSSVNGPSQAPKKRFSALKDVFSRSNGHSDAQQPPPSAHSMRPSMLNQGQSPAFPTPNDQPGPAGGHPSAKGRDRSSSNAANRPFTSSNPQEAHGQYTQSGSGMEDDRGRKASSGGLLGFLKNRPDSKTRDGSSQQTSAMASTAQFNGPSPPPGQQVPPQLGQQQNPNMQQGGQFPLYQGQAQSRVQPPLGQRLPSGQFPPQFSGPVTQPGQPGRHPLPSQQADIPGQQFQPPVPGQQKMAPLQPTQASGWQPNAVANQPAVGQDSRHMVQNLPGQQQFDGQRFGPQQHLAQQQQPLAVQQQQHQSFAASSPPQSVAGRTPSQAGSPQVGSPVSQSSHAPTLSTVEQVRQQNDSPLSFRQGPPAQHHGQQPENSLTQAPIRKPVPVSSPKAGDQLNAQWSVPNEAQSQRNASFSSLQRSPTLAPLSPTASGASTAQEPMLSESGARLPLGSHPIQPNGNLPQNMAAQQVSPVPTPSPQATRQSPFAGPPPHGQAAGPAQGAPVQQLQYQQRLPQQQQLQQRLAPQASQNFNQAQQQMPQGAQQGPGPIGGLRQPGATNHPESTLAPPQAPFLTRTSTNQSGSQHSSGKEQSTVSRFFKGITSGQSSGSSGHEKPDKEKKSSFMSSFLRGSKPTQQQPQPPNQGPFHPNQVAPNHSSQGPPLSSAAAQRDQQTSPGASGQPHVSAGAQGAPTQPVLQDRETAALAQQGPPSSASSPSSQSPAGPRSGVVQRQQTGLAMRPVATGQQGQMPPSALPQQQQQQQQPQQGPQQQQQQQQHQQQQHQQQQQQQPPHVPQEFQPQQPARAVQRHQHPGLAQQPPAVQGQDSRVQARMQNLQRQVSGQGNPPPIGAAEPRYDQVPIPGGYTYVRSEGSVAPPPIYWPAQAPFYGHQPGQPFPPQQQWIQNGMGMQQPPPQFIQNPGQGPSRLPIQGGPQMQRMAQAPGGAFPGPVPVQQQSIPVMQGIPPSGQTPGHSSGVTSPAQSQIQGVQVPPVPLQVSPAASLQSQFSVPPQMQTIQQGHHTPPAQQLRSPPFRADEQSQHAPAGFVPQPAPYNGQLLARQGVPTPVSSPEQTTQPSVSPLSQPQSRGEPAQHVQLIDQQSAPQSPQQSRHMPASPQSLPLPETAFSPVNTEVVGLPNPPLPDAFASQQTLQTQHMLNTIPQRQVSAVSQMSVQPRSEPPQEGGRYPLVLPSGHVVGGPTVDASPNSQDSHEPLAKPVLPASEDRTASPAPVSEPSVPNHAIVQEPIMTSEDNIYDATPRTSIATPHRNDASGSAESAAPVNEPQIIYDDEPATLVVHSEQPKPIQDTESQEAQRPHVQLEDSPSQESPVIESASVVAQSSSPASQPDIAKESNGTTTPPKSTSADIFEEAKRQMMLREQEEKIPVFPTEPDMEAAAAQAAKKKVQEEQPHMSATSYPGQEWNPYGEFDSWED